MGREIFLVRGDLVVWRGIVETTEQGGVRSTRACFDEAWQRALSEGAVTPDDAGRIQFRLSPPA
jgi:hypothetical protein